MGSHGTRQKPALVASKRYQRHEPEATPLYQLVAGHLETFLAEARETHERALPQYVERELRDYLKCGVLAYGFLRARCRSCGKPWGNETHRSVPLQAVVNAARRVRIQRGPSGTGAQPLSCG